MRLTSREHEIAEILKKEPLISQDELAKRLFISRSSVAVHISNLMKKGIIVGKGYVFNKKVSMVVVGEVFLEIRAKEDDNNTQIDVHYAGFGIEVSKTLANYGVDTKLITMVGNDELGTHIMKDLKEHEIDIANISRHPNKRTCRKIIKNNSIDVLEGYKQEEFEKLIETREWIALNCDWLVIESIFQDYICTRLNNKDENLPYLCGGRYIENEIPEFLNRFALLVLGVPNFSNYDYYITRGTQLVQSGTRNCIITDGKNSIIIISDQGIHDFTLPPNQSFNSCTDINLFLAGLVYGLSSGYQIRQALRIAIGTASASENDKAV